MTLTPEQRARLRELAERATPGPWKHVGGPLRRKVFTSPINEVVAPDIEQVVVAWPGFDGVEDAAANAAYIAAAHPQAVLEEMTAHDALAARVVELEAYRLNMARALDRALHGEVIARPISPEQAWNRLVEETERLAAEHRALLSRVEAWRQVAVDFHDAFVGKGMAGMFNHALLDKAVAAMDRLEQTATRPPEAPKRRPLKLDVSREWCIAAAEAEAEHDVSAGRPPEAPESSIVATLPPGTTHGDFTDCPFCGQECVPVPHTCPAPEAERKRHHHETWCQSFYMANEPAQNTGPFGGYPCNCKEAPKGGPR